MNYGNPQLRERLAAEYVSGAMRGGARRRFEGLMAADANLRRQVRDWEDDIYPLVWSLPPSTPPQRVWRAIQARLRIAAPSRWGWSGLYFWRLLSGGLAALLIAGVVIFPGQVDRAAQEQMMAVLQTPKSEAMLVVRADGTGAVHVHTLQNLLPYSDGKALELWVISPGQAPVSLGLVQPQGLTAFSRPRGLAGVGQLAVSLEPPGGSPTGSPTGPVIMSGDVLEI